MKSLTKRKITVVLVDRANYSRLKPVMEETKREALVISSVLISV